jgi:cytochrome c-type biogenesis protein CcmH/NrfG
VYLYRAVTYLAQDEGQKAVNDLVEARRLDTSSFTINLGLGRALLMAGRLDDAIDQIDSCLKLAEDDEQLAAVYYWRATANEMHDPVFPAVSDWQALLALPDEAVPAEWRRAAEERLATLTPSPTATRTPKPSSTPRPSPTQTKRASVTPTNTKRVTPTLTP